MVYGKYTYYGDIFTSTPSIPRVQHEPIYDALLDNALLKTGNGKFHFLLFVLVGAAYSSAAMEMTIISFLIPTAKCDLKMTSQNAGLLTALPMIGMVLGSFVWGTLADLGGRKWVFAASLTVTGVSGLLSSFSQYFYLFVAIRVVNGFGIAGTLSLALPYLGEFQPLSRRERTLCWMELCWTAGIIGLPLLAWLVIPLQMRYESPFFVYDSWNVFTALDALFALAIGIWAWTFPETPRYLYSSGEFEKALKVLKYMYSVNTGNDPEMYMVDSLYEKGISIIGKQTVRRPKRTFHTILTELKRQSRLMFKGKQTRTTLLVCFISFGIAAVYYTLVMWFPELFTRFQYFEQLYPNRTTSVCEVSSVFVERESTECTNKLESRVYMNTLILGLSCIPTSIWLPLCVNKLGAKFFIIFCVGVASTVCSSLIFVTSSTQNLVLSCIFEASISLGIVTLFMALVELFPTEIRVMGSGLSSAFARIGALCGNLAFGYLIDQNCVIPITTFSALLILTGIAAFFLPIKRGRKDIVTD